MAHTTERSTSWLVLQRPPRSAGDVLFREHPLLPLDDGGQPRTSVPIALTFTWSGRGYLGVDRRAVGRRHLRRYLGGHEQFHTRFGATAGQPDQNCCRWLNVAFRFSGSSSYSARSRLLPRLRLPDASRRPHSPRRIPRQPRSWSCAPPRRPMKGSAVRHVQRWVPYSESPSP